MPAIYSFLTIVNTEKPEQEGFEDEARGWDALTEWTGGLAPDQVDELRAVRNLEVVYPLLHALLGRSPRDFFVRGACLQTLVADGRPAFAPRDLEESLYWLDKDVREATLRTLRASGWLEYVAGTGTIITDAGRWAYDVLSFLHKRLGEGELKPTVAGVEYALEIGVDPQRHLESLRSRLNLLRLEIETARASYSEVTLRRAAGKLDEALQLSGQIRAVLKRVSVVSADGRKVSREIHDLLAYLHGAVSDLHADVTEVGRQFLRLTAGMTVEQIVRALMPRSREELASVAKEALLSVLTPPPLLNTDVVGAAAEQQVLRERVKSEPIVWEEPVDAPKASEAASVPEEVLALLSSLGEVVRVGRTITLQEVVPGATAGESFLRASLLPLAGDRRAGEGIAGQLGSLPLGIEMEGDGWPEPINAGGLHDLTPGALRPKPKGQTDG